jgi:hypothetical protein
MNNQPSITTTRNLEGVAAKLRTMYGEDNRVLTQFPQTGRKYSIEFVSQLQEIHFPQKNAYSDIYPDNSLKLGDELGKNNDELSKRTPNYIPRPQLIASRLSKSLDSKSKIVLPQVEEELLLDQTSPIVEVNIAACCSVGNKEKASFTSLLTKAIDVQQNEEDKVANQ